MNIGEAYMCGRYTLYADPQEVIKQFRLGNLASSFAPSYNIAPSQLINVIAEIPEQGERNLVTMRWGFIPSWQKEDQPVRMINCARLESIDEKPTFKRSFTQKRCLIPADGFYEWNKLTKQPYYIQQQNRKTFGMAGIWNIWQTESIQVMSCCIITQNPNPIIEEYHDRMPVIVAPEYYDDWLDPKNNDVSELRKILIPLSADNTSIYPVTKEMNKPSFNNSTCIIGIS